MTKMVKKLKNFWPEKTWLVDEVCMSYETEDKEIKVDVYNDEKIQGFYKVVLEYKKNIFESSATTPENALADAFFQWFNRYYKLND